MKNLILILLLGFCSQTIFAADAFKNGSPFFGDQDKSLPRNILLLVFQGGGASVPMEQQGAVAILKEALQEGPANVSISQFKQELFDLGAEFEVASDSNVFEIILKAPASAQEKALQLVKRTLENPRTSEEDFKRYQGKVLAGLKAEFEDMRSVIFYFAPRDLMGSVPQLQIGSTSPSSLEKVTYQDFKTAIPKLLNYPGMFVSYVGSEAVSIVKTQVQTVLSEQLKTPYQRWKAVLPDSLKLEKNTYTVLDKPGATDNQIMFLFPQKVKRDSPEWQVAQVTMDTLGGGLHGRLGKVLRSERGLTYHASSNFSSALMPYWVVWTFGGLEQTKPLLTGVPEVVEAYKASTLTAEDLKESKARLMNSFKMGIELPKDRLQLMGWYYANGLPTDLASRFPKNLAKVDLKTLAKFRTSLQSKVAAVYIMGDKAKVLPMLEAIGVAKDSVRIVPASEIK